MAIEKVEDLRYIGNACGKMSEDIFELHPDLEKALFVVPLRGGWPIWKGTSYGLHKISREKHEVGYEANVVYLPASSIVEKRNEFIQKSVASLLGREFPTKHYESVVIVDEAASGSSSKMVFDNVKRGVKDYKEDKDWKRFYWKKLPVELYLVVAGNGRILDPRIQKLSNVFHYPIEGRIITTDNGKIYPIEYITEIRKEVSTDGKTYRVVKPDILFGRNELWNEVVKEIEWGVDEYFESRKFSDDRK